MKNHRNIIKSLKSEMSVETQNSSTMIFKIHHVLEGNCQIKVRRVYVSQSSYTIGWVHDADIKYCMSCAAEFSLIKRKHHCRSCGNIYCNTCSPYVANLPCLLEDGGSRVCINCFGLRHYGANLRQCSWDYSPEQMELCHAAYKVMRGLIPPDIWCTTLSSLRDILPLDIANRIWSCRALWLICMHSDDIRKVHPADLVGKYAPVGLDIIELRALWFVLPTWDCEMEKEKIHWKNNLKQQLDDMKNLSRHPVYEKIAEPVFDPNIVIEKRYCKAPEKNFEMDVLTPSRKETVAECFLLTEDAMDAEIDKWLHEIDMSTSTGPQDTSQPLSPLGHYSPPYICTRKIHVPDSDDDTLPPTPIDRTKTPFSSLSSKQPHGLSSRRPRNSNIFTDVAGCDLNKMFQDVTAKENIVDNLPAANKTFSCKDNLIDALRKCDILSAQSLVKVHGATLNPKEATCVLQDILSVPQKHYYEMSCEKIQGTILFLADEFLADLNLKCQNGEFLIASEISSEFLCLLISRGASISLACKVLGRIIALSSSQLRSLVSHFEEMSEVSVLTEHQYSNYVIILIIIGDASKAALAADAYNVSLCHEVAKVLMSTCKFEEMSEPVEVFEFLERCANSAQSV